MNSTICQPLDMFQCIWGVLGIQRKSKKCSYLTYFFIGLPPSKLWITIANCTFFLTLSPLLILFTCCKIVASCLQLNKRTFFLCLLFLTSYHSPFFTPYISMSCFAVLLPTCLLGCQCYIAWFLNPCQRWHKFYNSHLRLFHSNHRYLQPKNALQTTQVETSK